MDILDGIAQIRHTFMAIGMKPPTTILLETHEEGMRFITAVRQTSQWVYVISSQDSGRPVEMADGSVWMEVEVMGIKVRWPANRTATRDGSWAYS